MGVEFFHAYRQTDMTKLVVALRKFANASKKKISVYLLVPQSGPKIRHTAVDNSVKITKNCVIPFCVQKEY